MRTMLARGLPTVAILALAACATSAPISYHTLVPEGSRSRPVAKPIVVALEPVDLANYLDRPAVVTRRGATALQIAENDQWGEQLDVLVGRVLAQDLAAADPRLDIVQMPTAFTVEPARQVIVEVSRFDADEAGLVRLDAQWQVVRPGQRGPPVDGRSRITEEAAVGSLGPDYGSIAEAMSRALAALAHEIAGKIP